MKTRPIGSDEDLIAGMLLDYSHPYSLRKGFLLVVMVLPPKEKYKRFLALDKCGEVQTWSLTYGDGSPVKHMAVVELEDGDVEQ